ncbi:PP2C family protein-serine/threonine phosphatase [Nocardioides sp. Root140]|uniref:PP2C family protein-serine/threonine phosphatase n=1 Tax=Nocardioides sp. Root140 TaxID=1736460 RepID=UPI0009EC52FC|nr:protein phosphatase 2C domain-containing protein [Nocardioides sp. Root140]
MGDETTTETGATAELVLRFAALSDVGRVRKDNQDSGYAGPWVLTVCDGVGGAARGDIASATAVQQLRKLDERPGDDMLGLVAGALHRAHDRISELVEQDPSINGTSTTATVALFDGNRVAIGHVGDSRAYLYREGALSQLTKDHTFVQSLIDEGRITEEESRVHPHRNLILKAVDGIHETEPDLFFVDLAPGDRLFLCSDGACGVLDDSHLADILSTGTPDYAVVELVRASLEAGSSDNVTCLVADVVEPDATGEGAGPTKAEIDDQVPLLVGAAADLPRRATRGTAGSLFRGHRSGDTGELEPVPAEIPVDAPGHAIPNDPIDPELARYAPRPPRRFAWLKRLGVLAILVGLLWAAAGAAYAWTQRQYYVGEHDGHVTIFRGVDASLPGLEMNRPYEESDISLDRLRDIDARAVREGIDSDSLDDARRTLENLGEAQTDCPSDESTEPSPDPTKTPKSTPPSGEGGTQGGTGGAVSDPSDTSSATSTGTFRSGGGPAEENAILDTARLNAATTSPLDTVVELSSRVGATSGSAAPAADCD